MPIQTRIMFLNIFSGSTFLKIGASFPEECRHDRLKLSIPISSVIEYVLVTVIACNVHSPFFHITIFYPRMACQIMDGIKDVHFPFLTAALPR